MSRTFTLVVAILDLPFLGEIFVAPKNSSVTKATSESSSCHFGEPLDTFRGQTNAVELIKKTQP